MKLPIVKLPPFSCYFIPLGSKCTHFRCLGRFSKESVLVRGSVICFVTGWIFYGGEFLGPVQIQAGGLPPIGCPRLLIQYIRSYPPYLEAVSSIRNLRTRHAMVTRTHLTSFVEAETSHYSISDKVQKLNINLKVTLHPGQSHIPQGLLITCQRSSHFTFTRNSKKEHK
jgi:hypothetical protein